MKLSIIYSFWGVMIATLVPQRLLKAMAGGLLLAMTVSLTANASVQINSIYFQDPNFLAFVKANYDTNKDNVLSDSEISAVASINVDDKNIKSLSGIQFFTNLTSLSCANNQIGALDFSKNTKIKTIWCKNNKISGTALRKMIASLPNRSSQSERGNIYYRDKNERENKGTNAASFPYTTANAKGWDGYIWYSSWQKIGANELEEPVYLNATIFPDEIFRNCLKEYDTNNDNRLSEAEIDALTKLDVQNEGIENLKGVERLTALTNLDCSNNEITSLDLSYNAFLHYVYCEHNRIFGVEMDNLTASLPPIPPVRYIGYDNHYSGVITLHDSDDENGINIRTKYEANAVSNAQCQVCVQNNWLPWVDGQYATHEGDEGPVVINPRTFPDETWRSYIKSTSYGQDGRIKAAEIAGVTSLSSTISAIASVAGIEYFSEVKTMSFYGQTNMTSINVKRNTKLEKLHCYNNKIETIDLSKNTMLKELNVNETKISSLDFTPVKNTLEVFRCSASQFRNFSFLNTLTKLKTLSCGRCELNSLDVSANTNLTDLECPYNNIQFLNLTQNTKLISLYCNNNQLTRLNLSKNTALYDLYCPDNKLISLTLPNPTTLKSIYIYGNQLGMEAMGNIYSTLLAAGNTNAEICLYDNALGKEGNVFAYGHQYIFTSNLSAKLTHRKSGIKNYDLSNCLIPQDVNSCISGSVINLPIKLQRSSDKVVLGFTFDLVLPDGVTLVKAETVADMLPSHTVSYTKSALYSGVYHITVEPSGVTGSNGTALNLTLNVMKSVNDHIRLQNAVFKVQGGSATSVVDYVVGPLTTQIISFNNSAPGDVNNSSDVTPADAIMILYHYFGVEQLGFNLEAADMNNDGTITPADAIEALYKYFGASGARATKPATTTATEDMDPE